MIMNAVLAVALGLAPTDIGTQTVQDNQYKGQIGRYSQVTDKAGVTHLRGFDRAGRPYNIAIANGHAEGVVGGTVISFDFSPAA